MGSVRVVLRRSPVCRRREETVGALGPGLAERQSALSLADSLFRKPEEALGCVLLGSAGVPHPGQLPQCLEFREGRKYCAPPFNPRDLAKSCYVGMNIVSGTEGNACKEC